MELNDKNASCITLKFDPEKKIRGYDGKELSMATRVAVKMAKRLDKMVIDAIIKEAKEAGITDLYVLNGEFIMAAIMEKMERDGIKKAETKIDSDFIRNRFERIV